MSACNHYNGGQCIICGKNTNYCCRGDTTCPECGEEICYDCWDDMDDDDICPVCKGEKITDDMLIAYMLDKLEKPN